MNHSRREVIAPENPAELEYKKARILMNAQELAHPVIYQDKPAFIQEFHRIEDPSSSGLKTFVYLKGNPNLIPATEITIKEQPK
jgi:hypothetical protein